MATDAPWPLEQHFLNILPQLPQANLTPKDAEICRMMAISASEETQATKPSGFDEFLPAGCKRMPNPPGCCHPPGDEKSIALASNESAGRNMSVLRHVALEMLLQTKKVQTKLLEESPVIKIWIWNDLDRCHTRKQMMAKKTAILLVNFRGKLLGILHIYPNYIIHDSFLTWPRSFPTSLFIILISYHYLSSLLTMITRVDHHDCYHNY